LGPSKTLLLGGQSIERVTEIRYLGLILDSGLTWYPHIDHIKSKIRPFVAILSKLKYYIPVKLRLQVYYAHVYSHIIYLNSIWGGACKFKLQELERLVGKSIRSVFYEDYSRSQNVHTVNLFQNHNLLSLKNICDYESVLLVHRLRYDTMRNDIFLRINADIHSYETRGRDDFHLSRVNNEFGRRSVHHHGIMCYNRLPSSLRETTSLALFRAEVRRHFLARPIAEHLF